MAKEYPHLYSGRHSRMDYKCVKFPWKETPTQLPSPHLRYFVMSSVTGHHSTALSERPERSRNAKAQARHRAKRKAYIEQVRLGAE